MKSLENTALLVMDIQEATVKILPENSLLIHNLQRVIENARSRGIPVIYVVLGFRKGFPEISGNNKSFWAMKANPAMFFDSEDSFRIPASLAPMPEEMIITKKRVSAFTGSDLEVVLRSLDIKQLILTGIATGGVVLSTLREAADKDYKLTVIADCCADRDDEVHRILTTKVYPRQALVVTAGEWCADI